MASRDSGTPGGGGGTVGTALQQNPQTSNMTAAGVATGVSGMAVATSASAGGSQATGTGGEAAGRVSNVQRIQQKKAQVRAWPRDKKMEKLAIYSTCRVS